MSAGVNLEDPSWPARRHLRQRRKVPAMAPGDIGFLLESSVVFVRSHTLYALALGAGMRTRHLHALDLGDVSPDGTLVNEVVTPHRLEKAGKQAPSFVLTPGLTQVVARYLAWRRARCAHFTTALRTYVDRRGVDRCLSCGDVADPSRAPLFVSRGAKRLSENYMRREFRRWRRELGLDPRLRFDSMRAAYRDMEVLRDGSYFTALAGEADVSCAH
jgi:hypothetical protein